MSVLEQSEDNQQALARVELLVATTWDCNLRCSYCFVGNRGLAKNVEPMSVLAACQIIDVLDEQFSDVETVCIHFYGGEPFCNVPAMRTMVERALSKSKDKFIFAVTTNGVSATPEVMDLLDRANFGVVVSIDGPPDIHNECRKDKAGKSTHDRVMKFIRDLREKTSCRVRGSAVVRSGWPLAKAVSYLKSLDVDTIKSQAVRTAGAMSYSLNIEEREEYLADLEKLGVQIIEDIRHEKQPRDDRFTSRVFQLLKNEPRQRFCGAGTTMFGITPDAQVLPCILLDAANNSLGLVNDREFREKGRRWVENHPIEKKCSQCSALPLCGGGCPAMMPFCGDSECDIVRKNCDVARMIYQQFKNEPEKLLVLAGM
ncbi:MAG: radical SAM protein [Smithella sp.]